MKFIGLAIPLFGALACAPALATASVMGSDLLSFAVLSTTYATLGDHAKVWGNVISGDTGTAEANSSIYGNFQIVNVATVGANALVQGNLQSILAGTIGDHATVKGDFQSGLVGTIGGTAYVKGNFISGLDGTVGAHARVDKNFDVASGSVRALSDSGGVGGSQGVTNLVALKKMETDLSASLATAKTQLDSAKSTLWNMGKGTGLDATMTESTSFAAGVYSAASWSTTARTTITLDGHGQDNQTWVFNIADILAIGANSNMVFKDVGKNAQVFWNTNGYATLGADSTFLGTILAETYVDIGANTDVKNLGSLSSCGGVYSATSYVHVAAGAIVGDGACMASGISSPVNSVPEPGSFALVLAGLGLTGSIVRRRTKSAAC